MDMDPCEKAMDKWSIGEVNLLFASKNSLNAAFLENLSGGIGGPKYGTSSDRETEILIGKEYQCKILFIWFIGELL